MIPFGLDYKLFHSSSDLYMKMGGIAWTREEDFLLINCIKQYGEGKWHRVPHLSGLKRCRKSCRLRWLNYLRPNIKRGKFSEDEVDLIFKLHKLLGNRWSLIAGRLPGRTGNDVKNYWNHHLSKKLNSSNTTGENPFGHVVEALAPRARTTGTSSLHALRNLPAPFSCEGSGQQLKHDDHNDLEVDDEDNPYWLEECKDVYRQLCQEVQFDQDLHACCG